MTENKRILLFIIEICLKIPDKDQDLYGIDYRPKPKTFAK